MKRVVIAFATIVVLGLAGFAFAQTDGADTAQPGTATNPSGTEPLLAQTNPSDTQPATQPSGDPAAPAEPAAPSAAAEPAAQPDSAQAESKALPATAGYNPLMIVVGVGALVAFATLLIRATRRVSSS